MSISLNTCMVRKDPSVALKHVNFAKKLHKEVKSIENVVDWAAIVNAETSYDVISSLANQFVQDVNKLILNLHDVMIKINKNQSSYDDLKVLVNKLSKTSSNLLDAFGQEHSVLQSKLIIETQNIVKEAQALTSIIEKDELHEFKIQLVDSLSEILSDLQKMTVYNHLRQLTPEELAQVLNECEEELRSVVAANHLKHETSVDKTILEGIARHTYHGVVGAQRVVFYLHSVANNYNDPIKAKINQAAKTLYDACMTSMTGVYQMNSGGEGTFLLDKCMIFGAQSFREMMEILNAVNLSNNIGGKDSENLKHMMLLLLSASLCFSRRFVRDMSMDVLEKL